MRLKLISCEIFYREMCAVVASSPNQVDIEFLPKGLHDIGSEGMRQRLQEAIDRVEEARYDAVLLGYGLCNNGICGLTAGSVPIVVPRAHDCITLFFGSKERYFEYFNNHPGVYFKTTGWIERGDDQSELSQLSIQHISGMDRSYEQLSAKYGRENAKYLYEQLCQPLRNYSQLTFMEMGIEPDGSFERRTCQEATEKGWKFEKVQGDMSLIRRLIDGKWNDEEFLIVQPGWQISAKYDEKIISAEPAKADTKSEQV